MGQYWFIVICGENLLRRVDLRVDRGRFKNHMIFREAPALIADDTEVVPPASSKQLDRLGHRSMPSARIGDESSFNPDYALSRESAAVSHKAL
jgi:hypothetical protein